MKNKSGCIGAILKAAILLTLTGFWVWGCSALFISGPAPEWLRISLALLFGISLPTAFLVSRSFVKGLVICLAIYTAFMIWWQNLEPSNDRDWAPDVSQISHGEMEQDTLTMYNVRNFTYTSENDFIERWETREYDLNKLQGLDIFLSYWASDHIAHAIMSWDFGDDGHLAVSIETRKEKTEEYSAIRGFFKQFELSYVAADEKDIIKLRTHFRNERVYLYRLRADNQGIRELLDNYLAEMNKLVDKPKFYDAFSRNCTTTIRLHTNTIQPDRPLPLDWRLILSGHLDELLYDRQSITHVLPFSDLRDASRVDLVMQTYDGDDFSGFLRNERQKRIDSALAQ